MLSGMVSLGHRQGLKMAYIGSDQIRHICVLGAVVLLVWLRHDALEQLAAGMAGVEMALVACPVPL
jgi:hypothetical protein